MSEIEQIKCPFCGTNKPLHRTGVARIKKDKVFDRPYEFSFGHPDLDGAFISIRECQGRGKGFPEVRRVTLRQAVENNTYEGLRQSLLDRCYEVMKILLGEEK